MKIGDFDTHPTTKARYLHSYGATCPNCGGEIFITGSSISASECCARGCGWSHYSRALVLPDEQPTLDRLRATHSTWKQERPDPVHPNVTIYEEYNTGGEPPKYRERPFGEPAGWNEVEPGDCVSGCFEEPGHRAKWWITTVDREGGLVTHVGISAGIGCWHNIYTEGHWNGCEPRWERPA